MKYLYLLVISYYIYSYILLIKVGIKAHIIIDKYIGIICSLVLLNYYVNKYQSLLL